MKFVIVGAGALRNLGAICNYARIGEPVKGGELALVDLDATKVEVMGKLAETMPEVREAGISVSATTDIEEALPGADFVYVTIRVGGVDGMLRDEDLGMKYDLHGHDDFGPSAASISIRTVPAMVDIAQKMERLCPDAWMINLTNPVPVLTEAVTQATAIKNVGVCSGPENVRGFLAGITGLGGPEKFEYLAAGIDHFGWWVDCTYDGKPFYPMFDKMLPDIDLEQFGGHVYWPVRAYQLYGKAIFATDHCFHWLYHDEMLEARRKAHKQPGKPRDQVQREAFERVRDVAGSLTTEQFWACEELSPLRPAKMDTILGIIEGLLSKEGKRLTGVVRNNGAIVNLPDDACVHVSCDFRDGRATPARDLAIPEEVVGLTCSILQHQKLLIKAIFETDREILIKSFLADPMIRSIPKVESLVDEILEANRAYLGEGWRL